MSQWREWAARFLPETAAAAGVLCVVWFSAHVLAAPLLVVAAIGASSALVFALPASPLAQPWSVVGSYVVSAVAGVIAAKLVVAVPLAAALAVGLSTLAERNAYRRRFGDLTCAEVMSKDVVSVAPDASLLETWNELRRHSISSLLVVNRARHVEGVVSLDDFVHSAQARTPGRQRQRLYLLLRRYTGGDGGVAAIMRLLGLVTQSDMIAALYHGRLAEES